MGIKSKTMKPEIRKATEQVINQIEEAVDLVAEKHGSHNQQSHGAGTLGGAGLAGDPSNKDMKEAMPRGTKFHGGSLVGVGRTRQATYRGQGAAVEKNANDSVSKFKKIGFKETKKHPVRAKTHITEYRDAKGNRLSHKFTEEIPAIGVRPLRKSDTKLFLAIPEKNEDGGFGWYD